MNLHGIFIEPTGQLRETIVCLKARVEGLLPAQTYASHPPHCTLLAGRYNLSGAWQKLLAEELSEVSPFKIQTAGFFCFHHDKLAGGGHTVAIKAEPSPSLFALQRQIAECFKRWWQAEADDSRDTLLQQEPFATSQARYGFPFVGPHWIPHFTIASLKVGLDAPILRELLACEARFEFLVDRVSAWEIEGDDHLKLCDLNLAGQAAGIPSN
jgi:hypothetical protein